MYGVISEWEHISIVWYDTLQEAFNGGESGDIIVKKIEELE